MNHTVQIVKPSVTLIASTKLHLEFSEELMPVLAARVSHGQDNNTGKDLERDKKLTEYLARHRHTSPFEHLYATLCINCPIFVAREWMRHRTQSFNEISMRYTSSNIGEMFFPTEWRAQDDKNRQVGLLPLSFDDSEAVSTILSLAYKDAIRYYDMLIAQGVCREQARMVIPVGHMTKFYASANLLNWFKFCKLRCAEDAQKEIRDLATEVNTLLTELYPMPWGALCKN